MRTMRINFSRQKENDFIYLLFFNPWIIWQLEILMILYGGKVVFSVVFYL